MPDNPKEHGTTESTPDALRRLEERLDRASRAAERLMAEVRGEGSSASGHRPPPAGWQAPRSEGQNRTDVELLAELIQSVRELVPDELEQRLRGALRELLLTLRALIDFYLERLERRESGPAEMEDIPIR
jgi:hypothetical protein